MKILSDLNNLTHVTRVTEYPEKQPFKISWIFSRSERLIGTIFLKLGTIFLVIH